MTDRDAAVLELAEANARANLPARVAGGLPHRTSGMGPRAQGQQRDASRAGIHEAVGRGDRRDLTYNRDAWPVLVDTLQRLQAPAILSASERRTDELKSLSAYLTERGLSFELVSSPMEDGYAANKIKIFRIARPPKPAAPAAPAPVGPAAPADRVVSAPQSAAQRMLAEARREAAEQAAGAGAAAASATPSGPSAKELAGDLLRSTFNKAQGRPWYDVDASLKQQRIDWAYRVVRSDGYDPKAPPRRRRRCCARRTGRNRRSVRRRAKRRPPAAASESPCREQ